MNFKNVIAAAGVLATLALPLAANADSNHRGNDNRGTYQQQRHTDQGLHLGQPNNGTHRSFDAHRDNRQRTEARFHRRHQRISNEDRRRMERERYQNRREEFREKHNGHGRNH
ncbi:MAG TPA: hypothetical protein VGK19_00700 [Capsulimonadaceae bacterium]